MPPIARIRLARSLPRLLAVPLLLLAGGIAIGGAAAIFLEPPLQLVGIGLGGVVGLAGLGIAVMLLSVRLEIEESAIGVAWLGGERIYPLTPGPVTRVRLRGENASRLRARTGMLGWGLGRARLRGDEEIEVVRLAATRTAILVPTERGRLAIAPASDDDLLTALSRAARARQRLEALADRAPEPPPPPEFAPGEPEEAEPQRLTGIERAILERRLADERAAARAAAAATPADTAPAMPVPAPVEALPAPRPAATRAGLRGFLRRPRPRAAFVLLPLVGAGIAWGGAAALGRLPEPGTDLARLTSLALVLAGPATSVGAVMALAWWPRLVGVVVAGGLVASVFIGRALLG